MVNSGLEGVVAATTRLSQVDGERGELIIAGYPVDELAAHATFEETTWLLWHGDLPSARAARGVSRRAGGRSATLPPATLALLRECARAGVDPMDALRMAAGTLSLASDDAPAIVARMPDDRRRLSGGCGAAHEPLAPRRDLGHAANFLYMLSGDEPDAGARARARDLSQHRRRSRPQRVDVHRARDHVDRIGSRLGRRRRARRAQGAAARRRARAGARHGVRDRRRVARRGGAAAEDRSGREADGLRPPRLQGARSARRRARRGRRADVHARRRHVALHAGARRSRRRRFGCSRSTSRAAGCRPTSSSTPRCCCTASGSTCRCSRRPSPSAASAAGSRTRSSSAAPTASSGRSRSTSGRATGSGCPSKRGPIMRSTLLRRSGHGGDGGNGLTRRHGETELTGTKLALVGRRLPALRVAHRMHRGSRATRMGRALVLLQARDALRPTSLRCLRFSVTRCESVTPFVSVSWTSYDGRSRPAYGGERRLPATLVVVARG